MSWVWPRPRSSDSGARLWILGGSPFLCPSFTFLHRNQRLQGTEFCLLSFPLTPRGGNVNWHELSGGSLRVFLLIQEFVGSMFKTSGSWAAAPESLEHQTGVLRDQKLLPAPAQGCCGWPWTPLWEKLVCIVHYWMLWTCCLLLYMLLGASLYFSSIWGTALSPFSSLKNQSRLQLLLNERVIFSAV